MDRNAPSNIEAERSLLGAIIAYPPAREELRWVRPGLFFLDRHAWVWEAFEALDAEGTPIDFVTVIDRLAAMGRLESAGGAGYLTQLVTSMPSAANAVAYARLVDREWRRRSLLTCATNLARAAYDGNEAAQGAALDLAARVMADGNSDQLQGMAKLAEEVTEQLINREALAAEAVPSGFHDWDKTLGGGLERGTLAVLMARPGMGKTSALCQIADFVSANVGPVAFFSLEMTARQIMLRMACRRARVSVLALRQGKTSAEAERRVLDELAKLGTRTNLFINDSPLTTDDMADICARLARRIGSLALVLSDHMRLFLDRADNETHRLGHISQAQKRLATNLNVAVLAAAQLSRGVEGKRDKRPDLNDLRDSGEIEENSDVVTALYRNSYYTEKANDRTAELINRKNRNGERNARATMIFLQEYMSFEPMTAGG